MSAEHEALLGDVREAILVQGAKLKAIAFELGELGLDEECRRLTTATAALRGSDHPMDCIRVTVPELRAVAERLSEAGIESIAKRLRDCCTALIKRANRLLSETQPIDDADRKS